MRRIRSRLLVALAFLTLAPPSLALSPAEFDEQLHLAQQHVRRGNINEAIRVYESLAREDPSHERVVRGYASALRQSGRFEEALEVYARADQGHSRPRFLLERITLLKQLDRRSDAMDLCLENLNAATSVRQFVHDEMLSLASDLVLWRRAYDDLRLRVNDKASTEAVATALAEICLRGAKYDEAVAVTRELDRSLGAGGTRLVAIAKRLETLGQHELALDVVKDVVPDLGNDALRREAALFRAELEVKLDKPQDAYDGLTWLVEQDPTDRHAYEIHLERARLLAGPLRRPNDAIGIYDDLLAESSYIGIHERVRLARAETRLALRRFEGALADCRELAATSRKEHVRERAAFMVGEIFFFQGEIDSAAAAYGRQVESFPTGLLTNDGLDRIFLFNENYDSDGSALVAMGKLHELASRGDTEEAIVLGDSLITQYALAPVEDDLLYYVASLAAESDVPQRALAHLDVISSKHAESRLAPRALKLEGEILETRVEDAAAALATYEDLLIRYPLSIEASEVRPRVTRLRQEVRS